MLVFAFDERMFGAELWECKHHHKFIGINSQSIENEARTSPRGTLDKEH